jgi:hypothetical protein
MTVTTRQQETLLDQLTAIAGSSQIVEEALRSVTESSTGRPTMRDIIRRILEIRAEYETEASATK